MTEVEVGLEVCDFKLYHVKTNSIAALYFLIWFCFHVTLLVDFFLLMLPSFHPPVHRFLDMCSIFLVPISISSVIKFPSDFIVAEVSQMSSRLTSESRIYADKARDLNRQVSLIWLSLVHMKSSCSALWDCYIPLMRDLALAWMLSSCSTCSFSWSSFVIYEWKEIYLNLCFLCSRLKLVQLCFFNAMVPALFITLDRHLISWCAYNCRLWFGNGLLLQ